MMTTVPPTILIADDDESTLSIFQFALARRGYKVLLADNGAAAIAQLEQGPVDIVFLDVLMPERDGLETLLQIKRRFPSLPVHVMSGGGMRGNYDFLIAAEKFGATSTMHKPVKTGELIEIIEALPPRTAFVTARKTA